MLYFIMFFGRHFVGRGEREDVRAVGEVGRGEMEDVRGERWRR